MQPFAAAQNTESFTVQWSGADADSGVASFTIYVSEDGGPFQVWLRNTAETSAVFQGQQGKTYGFYSLARDNTGNVEGAKTTAHVLLDGAEGMRKKLVVQLVNVAGTWKIDKVQGWDGGD